MKDVTYPISRIDALTDGVFGVAMTLLVLDVRIGEDFHPHDNQELLRALLGLWPKFFPYALSFMVLGLRWLSSVQVRPRGETVGGEYAIWWLWYLLLVTCVPFSTAVVGRFANYAPAVWVYAANTALVGFVAIRMMRLLPDVEDRRQLRNRYISQALLIVTSALAVAVSFANARAALWVYMLNLLAPALAHRMSASEAPATQP